MREQIVKCLLIIAVGMLLVSCSGKKSDRQQKMKMEQYMLQGKLLYMQYCSACHQEDQSGLARLYPPLDSTDYMRENINEVACLIRFGIEKPLVVNGVRYTQPMPGIPSLTNLEIAEIMTYIYNTGGHQRGFIEVKTVDSLMRNCK